MSVQRFLGQAIACAGVLCVVGGGTATAGSAPARPVLSRPLRDLPQRAVERPARTRDVRALQRAESLSAPSPNFDGIPQQPLTCNCSPPAPSGDVGPSNYVQAVNLSLEVFNKSGASLLGPVDVSSIYSGLGGACAGTGLARPQVQYDQLADRWVISTTASGTHLLDTQCFAVSQTSDPTAAYYLYAFPLGSCQGNAELGVWPDGYYVGAINFSPDCTTLAGPQVFAFDRAKMLLGLTATSQTFGPFAPNPLNGSTPLEYPLPADLEGSTQPAPGTPEFFFGLDPIGNAIGMGRFHVDWAVPASSTFTAMPSLATAPFIFICPLTIACVSQGGTSNKVDDLGDRLMPRAPYRVIAGHDAVVLNHTVVNAGSGLGDIRWYEVRNLAGGSPAIFQYGEYGIADGTTRWAGSIAMDRAGNMALGFSESSSQIFPRIRYTGRLVGDAAGTMTQAEQALIDGTGSETSTNRWGDYTSMTVDPVDGCTFWYTNEYYVTSGFVWSTRIGAFKFTGQGECNTTTAVQIARFSSRWTAGGVAVSWRSPSVARILGFDVFRNGLRLNRRLIPATGTGAYRYLDRTARRRSLATYRLRIVDLAGKTSWYGVSVLPAP
jgi:hypothetical protein